ncbi:MAG TPA: hypothetical protein VED37_12730 [Ktedonobacteraceae bacterium]|nr:hypothetical protein [Ktedonobacteraceae bacterium]
MPNLDEANMSVPMMKLELVPMPVSTTLMEICGCYRNFHQR